MAGAGDLNRASLVGEVPAADRLGTVDLGSRLEPQVRNWRAHSAK